jgi:hypothetical protein
MNKNYQVDVAWIKPRLVRLTVRTEAGAEKIHLSRAQAGVLFLFTSIPELDRAAIYDWMYKIGEGQAKIGSHRAAVSRVVRLLRDHELIVETPERSLFQTFKGRVCWLAIQQSMMRGEALWPGFSNK